MSALCTSLGISRQTLKPVILDTLIPLPVPEMGAMPWGPVLGAVLSADECPQLLPDLGWGRCPLLAGGPDSCRPHSLLRGGGVRSLPQHPGSSRDLTEVLAP